MALRCARSMALVADAEGRSRHRRRRGPALPTWRQLIAACGLLLCAGGAVASHPGCGTAPALDAAQWDRLLRVAGFIQQRLDEAAAPAALVSRSGVDLSRFALAHSHAGIALRAAAQPLWVVRQLYYDCAQDRPRIFDQGLAGFLLGGTEADAGRLSLILLAGAEGAPVREAASDDRLAVRLLSTRYSANAHAFSTRYQNCNQWVAELLATAWSGTTAGEASRERAQAWLAGQAYPAHLFDIGAPWLLLGAALLPWFKLDDHPQEDLDGARLRVSMPSSLEAFVLRRHPASRRLQFCWTRSHVLARSQGPELPAGCEAGDGDELLRL
jgi:hypothetical protein